MFLVWHESWNMQLFVPSHVHICAMRARDIPIHTNELREVQHDTIHGSKRYMRSGNDRKSNRVGSHSLANVGEWCDEQHGSKALYGQRHIDRKSCLRE